jgi:hypothetical protein
MWGWISSDFAESGLAEIGWAMWNFVPQIVPTGSGSRIPFSLGDCPVKPRTDFLMVGRPGARQTGNRRSQPQRHARGSDPACQLPAAASIDMRRE